MKFNPIKRIAQCCLILLMALNTSLLFAQNITVKGNVHDSSGESIIGASIRVEGTTIGTITDVDGNYSLSCPAKASLTYSYMGYVNQVIPVNGKNMINVTLKEDTKTLDEVVVVGYGVQRKSDLTGAVSSVKASEAIKQMPVSNIANALQGRMSGVTVINSSGAPDATPEIRVRGINSIEGEGGPLVVIDGFIGGSLASLNPTDIASVEVLKDASATAVYGSRGANGVILVTTKRPDKGAVKVDISSYVNIQTPYEMLPMLDAAGFVKLSDAYLSDRNLDMNTFYPTDEKVKYLDGTLKGYNYFEHLFRKAAIQNVNELSISGGSDAVRFLFSGSYNYNEGTILTSKSDRFNYNLKIDADIKKWLKVGFNTRGDYYKTDGPDLQEGKYNPLLINVLKMSPTIMPRNPDTGEYNNYAWPDKTQVMYNPMGQIEQVNKYGYTYNSYLQGFLDITFMKGLTFRMQQSFNFSNTPSASTNNEDSYKASGISGTGTTKGQTTASVTNRSGSGWLNTNTLNYMSSFNDNHRINATLVFEQSSNQFIKNTSGGSYLLWNNPDAYNNVNISKVVDATSEAEKTTMMSALARINYALFNRYMFTFSYRLDGSSRLAYKNRWEGFLAGALAWDIRNEKFFEPAQDIFDQFKLRVGYGETGNQNIPAYSAYSKYKFNRSNNYLTDKGQWATSTSMVLDERGNPDLCWERTVQTNLGLDLSLFNSRLTLNFDTYYKNSTGVLMKVNLPSYTGFNYELRNAARIENRGYEFTIAATPIATKDWEWTSNLVLSFGRTKMADLGKDSYGKDQEYITVAGGYANDLYRYFRGEAVGTMYGYVDEGVWTTQALADFKGRMLGAGYSLDDFNKLGYVPGQYRYKHAEGREFEQLNDKDKTIIGNGQPKCNWGWTNAVNFRDLDFSLYMIGYHGFDIYNFTAASRDGLTPNPKMFDRWTPENESSNIAGFIENRNGQTSTRWVEKGDFVKIKSITLGYSLPKEALQKIYFSKFRIYASIQNPFIITKYSGMDPEVTLNSFLAPGNDYGYYPNGRSFIVGLNVAF